MNTIAQALLGIAIAAPTLAAACAAAAPGADLQGIVLDAAYAKPAFTLADTRGELFDFRAATAGRLTLLYFGYTHCDDVCPLTMSALAGALRTLPPDLARRTRVVFVTVDPARDTPAVLRSWLANFDRSFVGLSGSDTTVARVEAALGLAGTMRDSARTTGRYEVGHAPEVIAFSPDDSAHVIYAARTGEAIWRHDLPRLLKLWPGRPR